MSRQAPVQRVTAETVPVFGPEPIGAEQTRSLNADYLASAAGMTNPVSNYPGVKGFGVHATEADFGALQDFTSVRTVAAKASNRPGFGASLPATTGSGTIQDQLGALGI